MKTYFAIAHQENDSAYGVWFPDVEGCFGAGDTYDEAIKDASSALQLHVETLIEMGEDVPEPRSIDDIRVDPEVQESEKDTGFFILPVPLIMPTKIRKRVSFNAAVGIVDAIDRQVEALGMTKTDWWLRAAREMLSVSAIENATPPKKISQKARRKIRARDDDNGMVQIAC